MLALLRQPRWIGLVAVTIGLCVLFWVLGSWQLDRHEERSARNAAVETALTAPPIALPELVPDPDLLAPEVEHRAATASGSYLSEQQTLQRNPRGRSGFAVVTPLLLESGGTLLVERGFVARAADDPGSPAAAVAAPSGTVEVVVRIREPQSGDRVAPEGQIYDIDPATYPSPLPEPVYSAYGELVEQNPPPPTDLELPEPADLGMGPHLYYAIQWWLFIPLAVVGLLLLLRREAGSADTPGDPRPVAPASH